MLIPLHIVLIPIRPVSIWLSRHRHSDPSRHSKERLSFVLSSPSMPLPSRQHAFSRDEENQALYDKLELAANLPGGASLARYNASCMRRGRPTSGLNVGVVYLTKTHVVFCAHFVKLSSSEVRICLPLEHIFQVRKAWYGRLLPNGILIRCKGFPFYLLNLGSKDEQRKFLATISAVIAEAKDADCSVSDEGPDDTDFEPEEGQFPESEPENTSPDVSNVQVQTLRKVQFARAQPEVHDRTPEDSSQSEAEDLQIVMDNAIANVQRRVANDKHQDSLIFFFSTFVLLFTTVCICAALYLLQLRISVIASHLVTPH